MYDISLIENVDVIKPIKKSYKTKKKGRNKNEIVHVNENDILNEYSLLTMPYAFAKLSIRIELPVAVKSSLLEWCADLPREDLWKCMQSTSKMHESFE